jgi:non-specific serine/threonine protein kinase/serine/threonine-protein kinase
MADLTAEQQDRVDALLDRLLDLSEAQRNEWLQRNRIEDPAVRAELESLLRAADVMGGFLSQPAQPQGAVPPGDDAAPGVRIGAWRILRHVGRGGMGEVYEAERVDGGFAQRAAIKLLQREAVAGLQRFHAERQILARLAHPGIARLYDGGVADDGRPYMAMEFVEGVPITEHCAQTRATLAQRLRLFAQVCEAVAYAHRNLVVHRDLKPANILVDAEGRVKLLDFGVAKLLAEDTGVETRTVAAPLTPIYAAPEQLTGAAITTATDVYALGLLLCELLTGARPWAQSGAPIAQALRTVLERPARVPSRIAAADPNAPVAAPALRGDLDAIVAKALRNEPAHRYETVNALKLDVERTLRGDPVAAREGARAYVFGRFLRRYRWAAAAATVTFVSLAGGLGAAAWQAHIAGVERDNARHDLAREEALRYEITGLFRKSIPQRGGEPVTARSMLDQSAARVLREYRDQPQLAGALVITLADLYDALEDAEGSAALLEGYLAQAGPTADPVALADARQKLANIELLRGHADRAAALLGQAEAFWRQSPQRHAEERLEGLGVRARLQRTQGDLDAAIATQRQAIAQRIALSGREHRETALLYNSLAITLAAANRLDEALAAYRETDAIYDALGLGNGLDAQIIRANTGTLALRTGHLSEAESLLKSAFEQERALAGDSAAVAAAMGDYGKLLAITARDAQAIAVLREAADLAARYAGANSPLAVRNRLFLAETQLDAGDLAAAQSGLEAEHAAVLKQYGAANPLTLRVELGLAQLAAAQRKPAQAQATLTAVAAALRKLGPQAQQNLSQALVALGEADLALGQAQAALSPLREAVALREGTWDQSFDLAEARERLGEALAANGDAQARALLQQAATTLASQLGAAHPQTLRAEQALARLSR